MLGICALVAFWQPSLNPSITVLCYCDCSVHDAYGALPLGFVIFGYGISPGWLIYLLLIVFLLRLSNTINHLAWHIIMFSKVVLVISCVNLVPELSNCMFS
jgi:hypothetical protein